MEEEAADMGGVVQRGERSGLRLLEAGGVGRKFGRRGISEIERTAGVIEYQRTLLEI